MTIAKRIAAVVADPDPAMKNATDPRYRFLMGEVTVLLDGEDVTRRCRGFSIPGNQVDLYTEDERGRKVLSISCGCGTTTNKERKAAARRQPICPDCGREFEWDVVIETRLGKVEVFPRAPFLYSTEAERQEGAEG